MFTRQQGVAFILINIRERFDKALGYKGNKDFTCRDRVLLRLDDMERDVVPWLVQDGIHFAAEDKAAVIEAGVSYVCMLRELYEAQP
jgi:hypothetical protein